MVAAPPGAMQSTDLPHVAVDLPFWHLLICPSGWEGRQTAMRAGSSQRLPWSVNGWRMVNDVPTDHHVTQEELAVLDACEENACHAVATCVEINQCVG